MTRKALFPGPTDDSPHRTIGPYLITKVLNKSLDKNVIDRNLHDHDQPDVYRKGQLECRRLLRNNLLHPLKVRFARLNRYVVVDDLFVLIITKRAIQRRVTQPNGDILKLLSKT